MDSWKKRLKEKIDCVLDTKEKKIGFAVIFTVCTLALWYAIAAIHVGFAYEDDSFLGLVRYYITGGHRFPWGVLLAFQAIFLFGGYALMQDHNIDIKAKALYAYYASNNALAPKDRIALRYIQDQFPVCESALKNYHRQLFNNHYLARTRTLRNSGSSGGGPTNE